MNNNHFITVTIKNNKKCIEIITICYIITIVIKLHLSNLLLLPSFIIIIDYSI